MKFLVASFLAIIWIAVVEAQGETSVTLTRIQHGISEGKEVLNVFDHISKMTNSDTFSQIARIGEKIGPFLGVIGPLLSIASTHTTSPAIAMMKTRFNNIDRQFGQVFNEMSDLEREIKESSLRGQYHVYERNIINLSKKMNRFLRTNSTRLQENYKRDFIQKYDQFFDDSANVLLDGMLHSYSFGYNIPYRVMEFTENHARETQKFMTKMLKLITQGSRIELTYTKLTQNNSAYLTSVTNDWARKIQNLTSHVQRMGEEVKSRWREELERNIDTALENKQGKSNEEFGQYLYRYLMDKFDWRDWLVVTYNPVRGWSEHCVYYSGGYHRFRRGGRNLVVSSVDDSTDPIDDQNVSYYTSAEYQLRRVDSVKYPCWDWGWGCTNIRTAKDIFDNQMSGRLRGIARGVISRDADAFFHGVTRRLVYVRNLNFHLYAFD